ncbi:hypothetical protein VQ042_24010, partial [Aurantimonas sp. A2-1-M11]
ILDVPKPDLSRHPTPPESATSVNHVSTKSASFRRHPSFKKMGPRRFALQQGQQIGIAALAADRVPEVELGGVRRLGMLKIARRKISSSSFPAKSRSTFALWLALTWNATLRSRQLSALRVATPGSRRVAIRLE